MFSSVNSQYVDTDSFYQADEWEMDRDLIKLGKSLGQGSFGMVYEGHVKSLPEVAGKLPLGDGKLIPVAVKTVNREATVKDRVDFLNEASIMK